MRRRIRCDVMRVAVRSISVCVFDVYFPRRLESWPCIKHLYHPYQARNVVGAANGIREGTVAPGKRYRASHRKGRCRAPTGANVGIIGPLKRLRFSARPDLVSRWSHAGPDLVLHGSNNSSRHCCFYPGVRTNCASPGGVLH